MIPTEHTEGTEPKHRDWNINRRARRARREFPRPFSAISACSAITVTGETRVVDVQSAKREVTLNSDIIRSIPTVRSDNAMVVIVPGVVTNLNDTVTGTATTQFPIHGGRNNALNSSAILTYSNTFVPGGIWLQPQSVLTGRPARISAEFSF